MDELWFIYPPNFKTFNEVRLNYVKEGEFRPDWRMTYKQYAQLQKELLEEWVSGEKENKAYKGNIYRNYPDYMHAQLRHNKEYMEQQYGRARAVLLMTQHNKFNKFKKLKDKKWRERMEKRAAFLDSIYLK